MNRYLYVMLSRTDTGMGRFIRFFTRENFNHVSLSVDDTLQHFVSFARYHRDVPLAGGYVAEPAERLLSCGNTMPAKIFRLDISQTDAQRLETLFSSAGQVPLIYNSLGALLISCHIPCHIPGCYTCLEFAGTILGNRYSSIAALEAALEPWIFYQGDLFGLLEHSENQSDFFFQKRGPWKGAWDTAVHFKALLWRIFRLECPEDPLTTGEFDIVTKNIPQSSI